MALSDRGGVRDSQLCQLAGFCDAGSLSPYISVFDGQLFHGDFTCLFLMACPPQVLHQYVHTVLQLAQPLHPIIIYYYQADVAQALDRIGAQRGQGWVESQVPWKVANPYVQRRGLVGIDGWKLLYRDYR